MTTASIWEPGSGELLQVSSNNTLKTQSFTATALQKIFTLSEFTYSIGTHSLYVTVNGVMQTPGIDFTETSSSSFTFDSGLAAGDKVFVIGFIGVETTVSDLNTAFVTTAGYTSGSVGSKLQEVVSVKDFGAVGNGLIDDGGALSSAAAYLATKGGGILLVPAGNYLLTTPFTLSANVTVAGEGAASKLIANCPDFITATSSDNIAIKNFYTKSNAYRALFTLCNELQIENVLWDGALSSAAALTAQGLWLKGCKGVTILGNAWKDYNNAIYLDASGGVVTDDVLIYGKNKFYITNKGNFYNFPTGVYCYNVGNVVVTGSNIFTNIIPGGSSGSRMGYGVYEGDGVAESITVTDNVFELTDVTGALYTSAVFTSFAKTAIVRGNVVKSTVGTIYGYRGGADRVIINGNDFAGSPLWIDRLSVIKSCKITDNSIGDVIDNTPAVIGVSAAGVSQLEFTGNTLNNCKYGMWVRFVDYARILYNEFIDLNTVNDSNDFYRGAVNFYGGLDGIVDYNIMSNTKGGPGQMQYGVVISTNNHAVVVGPNNRMVRMTIGNVLRGHTSTNRPGVVPRFTQGNVVYYSNPSASSVPGEVCTNNTQTTLSAGSIAGATTLTLVSVTGLLVNDYLQVTLDNGNKHYSTISNIAGNVVTVSALSSGVSAGAEVFTCRMKQLPALLA